MIGLLYRLKDNRDVDVFTVHERPDPATDRIQRATDLVLIRDGFSWLAALLPPVYFLTRGRWVALAIYLAAISALAGLMILAGTHADWVTVIVMAFNAIVGFEAANIERATLALKGWKEIGTVTGKNRAECERRFFERWMSATDDGAVATTSADGGAEPHIHSLWRGFAGLGA
ncbi:MAG: DUF2628 domain-containing protein [Hyphomicrobium sp.]|nr:DUF2628 domain-containing protein [Hyphomicrobium sp.]